MIEGNDGAYEGAAEASDVPVPPGGKTVARGGGRIVTAPRRHVEAVDLGATAPAESPTHPYDGEEEDHVDLTGGGSEDKMGFESAGLRLPGGKAGNGGAFASPQKRNKGSQKGKERKEEKERKR